MKKTLLFLVALFLAITSFAQEGINYKAIISDAGAVVASQSIELRFTILENGTTSVYQETHAVTTDANGIVVVNIGEGDYETGNWVTIDWRAEQFLKVEVSIGSGFTDMGTTAFKTVPHAKSADKLMPTDRVVIGDDSMNHGERLYIEVATVQSSELVDFKVDSPVQEDDIINLEFGTVPSSGNAQFIEARAGGDLMFKVNHTGAIYTAGGIDTDNDINIFGGDLNAYNNANIAGNLAVTEDFAVTGNVTTDLEMGDNEIHGVAETSDSDMKAYKYGAFITTNPPSIVSGGSGGFSVVRYSAGDYAVTYDTSNESTTIVATYLAKANDEPLIILQTQNQSYTGEGNIIQFKTYNSSGNIVEPNGGSIHFVIYKR